MEPFSTLCFAALGAVSSKLVEKAGDALVDKLLIEPYLCRNLEKIKNRLQSLEAPINHDIQRAVRSAYLNASYVTVKSFVIENYDQSSLEYKVVNLLVPDKEIALLKKILRSIRAELHSIFKPNYILPENIQIEQVEYFIQPRGISSQEKLTEFRNYLQTSILNELDHNHGSLPPRLINNFSEYFTTPGLTEPVSWFNLFMAFFQAQIKENTKLSTILQSRILANLQIADIPLTLGAIKSELSSISESLSDRLVSLEEALIRTNQITQQYSITQSEIIRKLVQFADDQEIVKQLIRDLNRRRLNDQFIGKEAYLRTKSILERNTNLLIGRQSTIDQIEKFILNQKSNSRELLITAPAGAGKTSLLAYWTLNHDLDCYIIYHFFGRDNDSLYNAYTNLLRQLFVYYEISFDIFPSDSQRMRDMIIGLIEEKGSKNGEPLIIIIDAIDEAGNLFEPLFPISLPLQVFIITSCRTSYDFDQHLTQNIEKVSLGYFTNVEIIEYTNKAFPGRLVSYLSDEAFINKLQDKTNGFPLFLYYLLGDLAQADEKGEDIFSLLDQSPKGFEVYVQLEFRRLARLPELQLNQEAQSLFALLAVALGSLSIDDIIVINSINIWDLQSLPWQVSRWFDIKEINDSTYYNFTHPILAAQFKKLLGNQSELALQKLLVFCAAWSVHESEYALIYYPKHLLDINNFKDLYSLLVETEDWYTVKYNHFQTHIPYTDDLHLALKTFKEPISSKELPFIVALQTALCTIYSLTNNYSDQSLINMAYLGDKEAALNWARLRPNPSDKYQGLLNIYSIDQKDLLQKEIIDELLSAICSIVKQTDQELALIDLLSFSHEKKYTLLKKLAYIALQTISKSLNGEFNNLNIIRYLLKFGTEEASKIELLKHAEVIARKEKNLHASDWEQFVNILIENNQTHRVLELIDTKISASYEEIKIKLYLKLTDHYIHLKLKKEAVQTYDLCLSHMNGKVFYSIDQFILIIVNFFDLNEYKPFEDLITRLKEDKQVQVNYKTLQYIFDILFVIPEYADLPYQLVRSKLNKDVNTSEAYPYILALIKSDKCHIDIALSLIEKYVLISGTSGYIEFICAFIEKGSIKEAHNLIVDSNLGKASELLRLASSFIQINDIEQASRYIELAQTTVDFRLDMLNATIKELISKNFIKEAVQLYELIQIKLPNKQEENIFGSVLYLQTISVMYEWGYFKFTNEKIIELTKTASTFSKDSDAVNSYYILYTIRILLQIKSYENAFYVLESINNSYVKLRAYTHLILILCYKNLHKLALSYLIKKNLSEHSPEILDIKYLQLYLFIIRTSMKNEKDEETISLLKICVNEATNLMKSHIILKSQLRKYSVPGSVTLNFALKSTDWAHYCELALICYYLDQDSYVNELFNFSFLEYLTEKDDFLKSFKSSCRLVGFKWEVEYGFHNSIEDEETDISNESSITKANDLAEKDCFIEAYNQLNTDDLIYYYTALLTWLKNHSFSNADKLKSLQVGFNLASRRNQYWGDRSNWIPNDVDNTNSIGETLPLIDCISAVSLPANQKEPNKNILFIIYHIVAKELIKKGDLSSAMEYYNNILKLYDYNSLRQLISLYSLVLNKFEDSREHLLKVNQHSNDPDNTWKIAIVYFLESDITSALVWIEKWGNLNQANFAISLYWKSLILLSTNQIKEFENHFLHSHNLLPLETQVDHAVFMFWHNVKAMIKEDTIPYSWTDIEKLYEAQSQNQHFLSIIVYIFLEKFEMADSALKHYCNSKKINEVDVEKTMFFIHLLVILFPANKFLKRISELFRSYLLIKF